MAKYLTLLYYKYVPIEDPEGFTEEHLGFCKTLGLTGRIIIAGEGINGTVSGTEGQCRAYIDAMREDNRFRDIDFKTDVVDEPSFHKMHVRHKPEIVHSGLYGIDPNKRTGLHLEPETFRKMMRKEDVVLVDMRSNYEHHIGRFKGSVALDMDNFRDLPEKVRELEPYKNKKIITYCTGGIKCEKASAYLLEQGFENVFQLHGGIIKYGHETGGEDFEGKCYVFDNRITVDVNTVNPKEIGRCYICRTTCSRMINCANPECNNHVIVCEDCGWAYEGACSEACQAHSRKRPYDGTGYYIRKGEDFVNSPPS